MLETEWRAWFGRQRDAFEAAYLAHDEPWRQSGFSGPAERWAALRRPVADCLTRDGALLDIGCANGHLLECCVAWAAERNITLDPYGVDLSPRLIALAQQRRPEWQGRFWTANALHWVPPRRFDFVRTELVYVPAAGERSYLKHLLTAYLTPDGCLLVANYNEGQAQPARGLAPGVHPTNDIVARLTELGFPSVAHADGTDALRQNKTRVAIVRPAA